MEVLTLKNRMSATTFLSLYFSKYVITGLLQWSGNYTISRGLVVSCYFLFCALPLITYFKSSIWQTFVCTENIIKCTYFYIAYIFETSYGLYLIWKEIKQLQPQDQHHQQVKTGNLLVQTSPPPEELLTEVREQLIQPSFMEQIPSN